MSGGRSRPPARRRRARSTRLACEADLAAGDARDVEQVVDQARQLAAPGGRSTSAAQSASGSSGATWRITFDGVADRRQRVAQLVGQHRQELVLAPVAPAAAPRSRAARRSPAWRLRYRRAFSSAIRGALGELEHDLGGRPRRRAPAGERADGTAPTCVKGRSKGVRVPAGGRGDGAGEGPDARRLRPSVAPELGSPLAATMRQRAARRGRASTASAGSPAVRRRAATARSGARAPAPAARASWRAAVVEIERCAEPLARLGEEVASGVFASAAARAASPRPARRARRPAAAPAASSEQVDEHLDLAAQHLRARPARGCSRPRRASSPGPSASRRRRR